MINDWDAYQPDRSPEPPDRSPECLSFDICPRADDCGDCLLWDVVDRQRWADDLDERAETHAALNGTL